MNAPSTPVAPFSVEEFLQRHKHRRSLPGDWINVRIIDENDDEIELECRVTVTMELDPYGTGDSPTSYEVEIHEAIHDNQPYDLDRHDEAKVIQLAIEEFKS